MAYVPDHVTQADDSPSQWFNCWAATGAWLADGASRGALTPTPSQFRFWARKPPRTTGGIADVDRGLTRKDLRHRLLYDIPRSQIIERFLSPSGLLYGAESDFNAWPIKDRCSPNFGDEADAYHFIGVVAGTRPGTDDGQVRVMDPLCGSYHWMKAGDIARAIVTYNNEHAGEVRGTADLIVVSPPGREVVDAHDHSEAISQLQQVIEMLRKEDL